MKYEMRNDVVEGNQAGSLKDQIGVGVDRYLDKKVTVALEYVIQNYEDTHATYNEKSAGEFVLGVKTSF